MPEELQWTEHPILQRPTDEEIALLAEHEPELLKQLHEQYEGRLRLAREDPLRHGFKLDSWQRIRDALKEFAVVLALGGNRSAKTTGFADLVMEAVTSLRDGEVVCFSQSRFTSVTVQQAAIWEYMPKEYKKKTKSMEGYINWSMQNGFTGDQFIFPDTRTRVSFKTYTQFSNDNTLLEGMELGFPKQPLLSERPELNIGTWLDEYLGDDRLMSTLGYRLVTRDAKAGVGFTPIKGYTPFVAGYLAGAETLKTRFAELLDRDMPIVQYSTAKEAGIVYLHTDENPFSGYDRLKRDLRGAREEEIMIRAYGYPSKSATGLLPMFSPAINVLGDEPNKYGMTFPDVADLAKRKKITAYQVVDPAGARNYVALWAVVDSDQNIFVVDEWPRREKMGEWALFGQPRWKRGPASDKVGYNVKGYADLFRGIEKEHSIEPFERIGDCRYFARENDDNDDLFTLFQDQGLDFVPSSGIKEADGIAMLDEWFSYNPDLPIDKANRPRCYIHERCGNLIDSLINYNMQGKVDEALKDFMDLLRYLRTHNGGQGPDHLSAGTSTITRPARGFY